MPAVLILDERDPFAFQGPGDDHHRPAGGSGRLPAGLQHLVKIMAVDYQGLPAKGLGPAPIDLQIMAVHGFAPLSQTIDVDHCHQIVQLVMGGNLHGLPDRALGHLAVAEQDIGAIGQFVQSWR